MDYKDYYKILGVDKSASQDDIKKAFRKLAHEHHPDKQHGNEEKFKEINEAHRVLSDDNLRANYDRFGTANAGGSGGFEGFNPNQAGGFEGFEFGGDMDNIFDMFFDGGQSRRRRNGKKNLP